MSTHALHILAKRMHMTEQWNNWLISSASRPNITASRGQQRGDMQLDAYLADATGPTPLIRDLRITYEHHGSSINPPLNRTLHFFNTRDIDKPLANAAAEKIRENRAAYNNN